MKRNYLLFVRLLAIVAIGFALNTYAAEQQGAPSVMNGIAFSEYKGFWTTWKPITTRYRVDNNEMRVTYANDVAQKAIAEGLTEFPEGSAFGKIAWNVQPDPLFPNSLQPTRVHRLQLMVMDRAKYPDSRGWGYAIFNEYGGKLIGNDREIVAACAACHEHAAQRGYVFLGTMDPDRQRFAAMMTGLEKAGQPAPIDYELLAKATGAVGATFVERTKIPKSVLRHMPQGTDKAARVGTTLSSKAFGGTANELAALALNAAAQTGIPAAFWSDDERYMTIAFRDQSAYECTLKDGKTKGVPYVTFISNVAEVGSKFMRETSVCL